MNQPAFPFRANLHVPNRADYRVVREGGIKKQRAVVTAGALHRADRALAWHERRAQQRRGKP